MSVSAIQFTDAITNVVVFVVSDQIKRIVFGQYYDREQTMRCISINNYQYVVTMKTYDALLEYARRMFVISYL